jgi:hypothetical protein
MQEHDGNRKAAPDAKGFVFGNGSISHDMVFFFGSYSLSDTPLRSAIQSFTDGRAYGKLSFMASQIFSGRRSKA